MKYYKVHSDGKAIESDKKSYESGKWAFTIHEPYDDTYFSSHEKSNLLEKAIKSHSVDLSSDEEGMFG
ncbi:MAG: hypothetical protein COA79_22705 [Planctomycetota bacterium]|nr:hypothetical protein [Bacteroidia bacterium]PCJ53576.1 MAG: hypothetical protein COA79_22705 [Planctomycetota bacterium]